MRYALTIFLVLSLISTSFAQPVPARDARTIRASGTAIVYVQPDEAEVNFTMHTFDGDLAKAKAANDHITKEVIEFVKSLKVEEKDVRSGAMRAERVYEDRPNAPREFKGYTVRREYLVVLRDIRRLEALTDLLLSRTDCTLKDYTLRNSENRKHRDEARRKAVRAAREKAELMASELKCTVGEPRSIEETTFSTHGNTWSNFRGNSNTHDEDARDVLGDAGSGTTHLGQIEMSAGVSIEFDLIPPRS